MIKINIHPTLIILLLIGLFGGFIKELILFLLITIFHELGHILSAKFLNIKCKYITLTLIGGFIELEDYSFLNPIFQILINISGILINLLIFLIFKVININFLDNNIIVEYNLLMIFFNLLPIPPLDGYKILKVLIEIIYDEEYTSDCLFYLSLLFIVIISIILFITKLYGYYLIVIFLTFNIIKEHGNKNYYLRHYSQIYFKK